MKVIFLDIDGVLNCRQYFETRTLVEGLCDRAAYDLDTAAVERLNHLVAQTGAVVVVSSSWRHGRSVEQLADILSERGFVGTVLSKTRDWHTPMSRRVKTATPPKSERLEQRGDQIRDWLDEHPEVDSFIVLDDDSDMDLVRDRHIKTSFHEGGLQPEHVERAIAMLT
jgi:HAD domain in Swiss Army Knife RNA repair proteins